MPHIDTHNPMPGIVSLLFYKPATGQALSHLAHTLLHGPSQLSSGERELIASYVSHLNGCNFCHDSHSAAANCHFGGDTQFVESIKKDLNTAPISEKMKALLKVAAKVQQSGKHVLAEDITLAKARGATDEEIHDAVLVAAAFCMYNRYVDGLATPLPKHHSEYAGMGKRLAKQGYKYPNWVLRKIILFLERRRQASLA